MRTTLKAIRAHAPCCDGWAKLLRHLRKTAPDDEPLMIETVLDNNGIDDALWCLRAVQGHDREIGLYAVWCARQVQPLMTDPRSIAALNVAERFARGVASDEERAAAAWAAARAASSSAWAATRAASSAAWAAWAALAATRAAWAAWAASSARASASAWAASSEARENEMTAQAVELRRICREIEAGRDPYPEEDGL